MEPSLALTRWIYDHYPYSDPLTHLKVQKLLFYCVGTAMAFDSDGAFGGDVLFQPWDHGPVNVPVWHELKDYRGAAIPDDVFKRHLAPAYPESTELPMTWALQIYGALDAWNLRKQSHLEQPWIDAYGARQNRLSAAGMKAHFKTKLTGRTVYASEHLQDPGTFTVDFLPVIGYRSMKDLADSIHLIYGQ
jgi:uncharacterized phage-associated protein